MVSLTQLSPEFPELNHPQLPLLKACLRVGTGLHLLIVESINDFLDGLLLLLSLVELGNEYVLILGCRSFLQPIVGIRMQSIEDIIGFVDEHSLEVQPQLHLPLHRRHQLLQLSVFLLHRFLGTRLDLLHIILTIFLWDMKNSKRTEGSSVAILFVSKYRY